MALFKIKRGDESRLPKTLTDGSVYFTTDAGNVYIDLVDGNGDLKRRSINPQADWATSDPSDKSYINNKPDVSPVYSDTTAAWNAQSSLISENKAIYIYTDCKTVVDEKTGNATFIPGIKVGDGKAYLIDIPFVVGNGEDLSKHMSDTIAHVTEAERTFWNNKVTAFISEVDGETIVFSKS